MNKELLKKVGFTKEVKRIDDNECPFCGETINEDDFKDALCLKEYKISGLCQTCQEKVFGKKD